MVIDTLIINILVLLLLLFYYCVLTITVTNSVRYIRLIIKSCQYARNYTQDAINVNDAEDK